MRFPSHPLFRVPVGRNGRAYDPAGGRYVLVVGGAGYIGSALLPRLLHHGERVRLLDRLHFGTEPIAAMLDHPRLELIAADFRQVDRLAEALRGVDAVVHLGAIVGDPACAVDEELTIEVNLLATRTIAELAKALGVRRFVFASTCSVYGAADHLLDETSALNPVSLYAATKIAAEQVLARLADERFAPVILRFGTVYGLSGRARFDLVINLLAAKAIAEGQITVFGGEQWRPFVHVDDVARAAFAALHAPADLVRGEVFNVGSNEQNYTIQQVGEIVQRRVPSATLVSSGTDTDRRNYRVSFDKIARVLGFRPSWSVEDGIEQVVEAIRSGRVRDYREARYSNLKQLLDLRGAGRLGRQNEWAYGMLRQIGGEFAEVKNAPLPVQA